MTAIAKFTRIVRESKHKLSVRSGEAIQFGAALSKENTSKGRLEEKIRFVRDYIVIWL